MESLTRSWKINILSSSYYSAIRFLFFHSQVTNSKLKNKKFFFGGGFFTFEFLTWIWKRSFTSSYYLVVEKEKVLFLFTNSMVKLYWITYPVTNPILVDLRNSILSLSILPLYNFRVIKRKLVHFFGNALNQTILTL